MNNKLFQSLILTIIFLLTPIIISNINFKTYRNQIVEPGIQLEEINLEPLNQRELKKYLKRLQNKEEINPKNAYIDPDNKKIIPEKYGAKLNIERMTNQLLTASTGTKFNLISTKIKPLITSKFILKNQKKWINLNNFKLKVSFLSTYATPLQNNNSSRLNNISIALKELTGLIINSQNSFSFNQVIGSLTAKNGYQQAPAIINNQLKPAYGGGVCQVSSTLYNTLLQANLKIVERHPHSFKVNYVPTGQDATVVPGFKDLKFKNNKKFPITIIGKIIDNKVVIYLLQIHQIN
ncbi:VanW family protein [Selenihalanaerobacter shriftii]|uniref:Putative peptidoglycan binding domain-containing protein n=1 Tax=Selenihalanaerobacter shriftii TaxID=142842 RepID=A0A1T4K7C2_9FIRM|nr:VanW family protein [Selenihalanaerobacter shriftii]SJZ38350.1 Putative peptidoglycan binding domain-containing protein [Selenihalanaerobacter shriftii]